MGSYGGEGAYPGPVAKPQPGTICRRLRFLRNREIARERNHDAKHVARCNGRSSGPRGAVGYLRGGARRQRRNRLQNCAWRDIRRPGHPLASPSPALLLRLLRAAHSVLALRTALSLWLCAGHPFLLRSAASSSPPSLAPVVVIPVYKRALMTARPCRGS